MRIIKKLLADISIVEGVLLGALFFVWFLYSLLGLNFYFAFFGGTNAWLAVGVCMFMAFCVSILVDNFRKRLSVDVFFKRLYFFFRSFVLFYLMIVLHFNLKMNAGLIHKSYFDVWLVGSDRMFGWYISGVTIFRDWLNSVLGSWLNGVYLFGYLLMFVVAFVAFHLAKGKREVSALLEATILTSMIGSLGYVLMPAVGPLINNLDMHRENYQLWQNVMATGAAPRGYFFMALAAMPSLHVAHAVTFTYISKKYFAKLLWFMIPMTVWIFIDAVYLRWHYVLDLIVGVFVAILAIIISERLSVYKETGKSADVNDIL